MRFIVYAEKLETIKYLSQHKRTGTPKTLAKKLDLSERTLQRMVQQLREMGCPISYDRDKGSYAVKYK